MRLAEILHNEHQRTLVVLDKLDGWRGKDMPADINQIAELLNDLVEVAESDINQHYAFEEDHLFPILKVNGAEFMTNMLQGEHTIIRPIAQEVSELAQTALKDGFTPDTWARFQERSFEFIGHETFHIQKEEMGLINALNMMLSPEVEAPLIELYKKEA